MTPKEHKNNTNEASMLLKTQGAAGKRTQNELKNEPRLEQLMRELMPNSELARLDGKKPLTRHATRAPLPDFWGAMVRSESDQNSGSPEKRAAEPLEEGSDGGGLLLLNSQLSTSRLDSGGTKRECL